MASIQKKKILILVDWFYPGYKAGGPIQSCRNFVAFMEDTYDLSVVTSDRDAGDDTAYPGIVSDKWNKYTNQTKVFYASALSLKQLRQLENEIAPDYIYLNSMFSPRFTLLVLLLHARKNTKATIILAPRGMLKKSALDFKPAKKKLFLALFRLLKIQNRIRFHATDATEVKDIKKILGNTETIMISNFPGKQNDFTPVEKEKHSLSMIFVGRVHPIKNLDLALQSLINIKDQVRLTIVGAMEDEQYWQQCRSLIEQLPANVTINIKTDVPHDKMESILRDQHLFILPTQGENFGHAIFESLAAGRPVLISDQTPWRNLASHFAGWDLPLNDLQAFTTVIEKAAAMAREEHLIWCKGAWQYCHDFIENAGIKEQYLKLFN